MKIAEDSIIKDDEIAINEARWKRLNEQLSQQKIIDLISSAIENYNLPLPLRKISIDEAVQDFQDLRSFDCRRLWKTGDVFTKHSYQFQIENKYLQLHTCGNKASDYFHQTNRNLCASVNAPSPYKTWTNEKLRRNWLKSLWTLGYKEINSAVLRESIALRNYTAQQFRPSAAKAIYELLESKEVLDFSAGWGDRLVGFCAAPQTESYFGCDPNQNLFEGYDQQVKTYGSNKEITMINAAAEDLDFGKERFDTVFTSPPFYRSERYTADENQSWVRYKTLETWTANFLCKVIEKSWAALKPNGFLALNLADVYSEGKTNKICDLTNEFIASLPDAEYVCGLGLRIHNRPNKAKIKGKINAEVIWVFRKQHK
ncbi:MAG: class I SAM-dependent methyltransferase [Acidobacteriota bacterium]|nr:class I SAM-dependent methyltransferase [Acidobacteriota bacterium]